MEGKENEAVKSNVKLLKDTVKEVPKSGEIVQQSSKQINVPNKVVKHLKLSHWKHRVAVNGQR